MMNHLPRLAVTLGATALIALLGACSSGGGQPGPVSTGAAPSAGTAAVTTPPAGNAFSGIAVMRCQRDDTFAVTAYDPAAHAAKATRTFNVGKPLVGCGSRQELVRQQFDRGLNRMAAVMTGSDGGGHVGYAEAGGAIVDLTPNKGSGYGAKVPEYNYPVFNPATDRLWFYDEAGKRYGSLDTTQAAPSQPSFGKVIPRGYPEGDAWFFSGNGKTVMGKDAYGPVTADGRSMVFYDAGGSFRKATPPDQDASSAKALDLAGDKSAPSCRPTLFISDNALLCLGDGTNGSPYGVYKMTLSGSQVKQKALVPASDTMQVESAVANPDRTQVAFIAQDRPAGQMALYTVAINGGEPQKVADLESTTGADDLQLVDWL